MKDLEAQLNLEIQKRQKAEQMLGGLDNVLKMLAMGDSLKETLENLIEYIESKIHGVKCSILLLDNSGQYLLRGAAPSLPKSYCDALDGFLIGPNVGSCGTAAYKNEMVIVDDIETSPLWVDFKGLALSHDLRACWSTPIVNNEGKVLGTLCPYFSEPRSPSEDEIQTAQFAAYLAGVAIQFKGGEVALKESETRYENLFGQLKSIMDGTSAEIGEGFVRSLVYNLAQSLGMKYSFIGLFKEKTIETLALWAGGEFEENIEYDIAGTPCEIVVKEQKACLILQDIQKEFPEDQILIDLGIQCYLGVPLLDSSGNSFGNLVVMDDKPFADNVTAEIILTIFASRAEAELIRRKTEMERLEAKELAEKASKAKSEFLARMSHELRTPMNSILGFTQLLAMDNENPLLDYQKENLGRVSSAGNHLLTLISEVLDLSKIESGNSDIDLETVDLVPIVDNVISISHAIAEQKNVSIKYEKIPEVSYFVEADPLRLKQVVLNLISNSIKYNFAKGSVVVSFEKLMNGNIRLGIRDTGCGISDDNKNKIFKPFERFHDDLEAIEGTGIGLAISKQFTELMGGTIGFESTAGEGSFFYIDFPISAKTSLPVQHGKGSNINQPRISEDQKKKKILYVEDIPANVDLVRQILNYRPNIELISSANALDGIKIAQAHLPDLILMDIHLPGMDGIAAFKKLQGISETENIPVIALTADAMTIDVKKAIDLGFHSYITKPIDVDKFFKTIDRVIPSTEPESLF
jgi:signal transduction histidine kinase/ActR/RegA family two-component response regulator